MCVVLDDEVESGGTTSIHLAREEIDFNMTLGARGFATSELARNNLPDGLGFASDIMATEHLSLADMLGLLGGSGSLTISQEIDEMTEASTPIIGAIPIRGLFTLTTVEEAAPLILFDFFCGDFYTPPAP